MDIPEDSHEERSEGIFDIASNPHLTKDKVLLYVGNGDLLHASKLQETNDLCNIVVGEGKRTH